jgi:hypothetical protein
MRSRRYGGLPARMRSAVQRHSNGICMWICDNNLRLDADTGSLCKYPADRIVSKPAVYENCIYFGRRTSACTLFPPVTERSPGHTIQKARCASPHRRVIFINSDDGRLHAVNTWAGGTWTLDTGAPSFHAHCSRPGVFRNGVEVLP